MILHEDVLFFCDAQRRFWLKAAYDCVGQLYKGMAYDNANEWSKVREKIARLPYIPIHTPVIESKTGEGPHAEQN